MNVRVLQGDVFDYPADGLVCPANPQLNLSGGVNGEILRRGGEIVQVELRDYLRRNGLLHVAPGTTLATSAGPLRYKKIIHAVAIDAFYDTNVELVTATICAAWKLAEELVLADVVMPALGTGYGRMPLEQFAAAFGDAVAKSKRLPLSVSLVVRDSALVPLLELPSR